MASKALSVTGTLTRKLAFRGHPISVVGEDRSLVCNVATPFQRGSEAG
jgi:hypothetical protein